MKYRKVTKSGVVEDRDLTAAELNAKATKLDMARVKSLNVELENIELQFAAKGLIWFIKREITEGRLTKAELPAKMVAAYNRMEEIEAELST